MSLFNRIKKNGMLGVAPEELKITLVAFAYIFFVICSYYVIKPIRGSLGLELGKDNIPILSLLSMIVLIVSNAIYSLVVGIFKRDIFIPFITRFFAGCLIVFWLMFSFVFPIDVAKSTEKAKIEIAIQVPNVATASFSAELASQTKEIGNSPGVASLSPSSPEIIAAGLTESVIAPQVTFADGKKELDWPRIIAIAVFYLWVGVFALFAVSMFWSFMNDVFSVGQSKRLYAIIGYGGLTGGAVGSFVAASLVPIIGTANLFIVALIILYPSVWCMKYVHKSHAHREVAKNPIEKKEKPAHPPRPWDGFLTVYRGPILMFMAFEMLLFTFSSTLFYQQLYEMVNQVFDKNVDETTRFFADFFGKITILSLFSQFFLTRLIMLISNPVLGLIVFPLIQIVATVMMLTSPTLAIVSWGLIIVSAINYSTGRAIRELVYIPLDREQKYQGKGFIDTVVFRLGDGLSAIILIGGLELFSYGIWIDWTILAAMALQFYVIIKIGGLYAESLKVTQENDSQAAV